MNNQPRSASWSEEDINVLLHLLDKHPNDGEAVSRLYNEARPFKRSTRAIEYKLYSMYRNGKSPKSRYLTMMRYRCQLEAAAGTKHPKKNGNGKHLPEFKQVGKTGIKSPHLAEDIITKIKWVFEGMAIGSIDDKLALTLIKRLAYGNDGSLLG